MRPVVPALLVMGFTAAVGQVLLIRELLVTFLGNELLFSAILFNWLISVAFGSFWLGRRFADKASPSTFASTQLLISILLPLQLVLARAMKNLLGIGIGKIVGIFPVFGCSFAVLFPVCIFLGFQFTLGCKLYAGIEEKATSVGRVYIYEALGSLAGGAAFTFLLIHLFHPFEIVACLALLNLLSAFVLQKAWIHVTKPISSKVLSLAIVSMMALNLYALGSSQIDDLNDLSAQLRWRGQELIHHEDSIYTNVVVTRMQDQLNFFASGALMFTAPEPDIAFAEEIAHFSLLMHPSPEKVLLIGGGAGGVLEEILKHPVRAVHYAELDPLIVEITKRYLPGGGFEDPKIEVKYVDGRSYVKTTLKRFDVIILNLPSPSTLQLNRFYTLEFFEEVRKILNAGGVFCLKVPWAEAYMVEELIRHNRCIWRALKETFSLTSVIPGDHCFYFASTGDLPEVGTIVKRFTERELGTRLLTEGYIRYKFSETRIARALEILGEGHPETNRDTRPVGVYHNVALWNAMFYPALRGAFSAATGLNLWWVMVPLIPVGLVLCFRRKLSELVSFSIATTGFAGISLDMLTIFAFQVTVGYAYGQIGILVASFMAGLAAGGFCMNTVMGKLRKDTLILAKIELAICSYAAFFGLVAVLCQRAISPLVVEVALPILNFGAGALVGLEFPLANKIYMKTDTLSRSASALYASDLFGACLGAVVVGIFFVPLLGILGTAIALALLKLCSFIALASKAASRKAQ